MMVRTTFDEVRRPVTFTGKCTACGKRLVRKTTVWQTVNPYNRNSDGVPKSSEEIMRELHVEAAHWIADMTARARCSKCSGSGRRRE